MPLTVQEALSILQDPTGKDFLEHLYRGMIENIQKGSISDLLKNRNLSGNPNGGSLEAKRFANSQSQAYGTARAAGKGMDVKAKPVIVLIDRDREIPEEIENKDLMLYSIQDLLTLRSQDHQRTLIRELERAFFEEAFTAGTAASGLPTGTPGETAEALIQLVETTRNDYVDGVDRDMINLVMTPPAYGELRNFLDTNVNNANVTTAPFEFGTFHGVRVFSSVYLPNDVKTIAMTTGSVALPIRANPYTAERIPLSEAMAVSLFFYYGVKAVTPDLIQYIAA